jgi:hypothetical protein
MSDRLRGRAAARLAAYWCSVCGDPILDAEPHTAPDGEDCHARCCPTCRSDQR